MIAPRPAHPPKNTAAGPSQKAEAIPRIDSAAKILAQPIPLHITRLGEAEISLDGNVFLGENFYGL